jgi:hypothetical protein
MQLCPEMLMSDLTLNPKSARPQVEHGPRPADLPPSGTYRWVARRKAQVVAAVRNGLVSLEEACRRYNISAEEFASWERALDRHGPGALRVTRLQEFRQA